MIRSVISPGGCSVWRRCTCWGGGGVLVETVSVIVSLDVPGTSAILHDEPLTVAVAAGPAVAGELPSDWR